LVKAEAYTTISHYVSQLSDTDIKTFDDIILSNEENTVTEGAEAGDHPVFATGQVQLAACSRGFIGEEIAAQAGKN
jgi:amidase